MNISQIGYNGYDLHFVSATFGGKPKIPVQLHLGTLPSAAFSPDHVRQRFSAVKNGVFPQLSSDQNSC